jgi:HEPN domain-containing protein
MALDPELVAETRGWMIKATHDLRAAETLAAASPPLNDEAVFHSQQAAEKAIKAFLVWHGQTFRKTHNLEETGEQCLAIDPSLRAAIDRAVPLSEYAWKFRYPGVPVEPDSVETAEALAAAREVVAAIASRLPTEVIG